MPMLPLSPAVAGSIAKVRETSTGGIEVRLTNGHKVRIERADVASPSGMYRASSLVEYAATLPARVRN